MSTLLRSPSGEGTSLGKIYQQEQDSSPESIEDLLSKHLQSYKEKYKEMLLPDSSTLYEDAASHMKENLIPVLRDLSNHREPDEFMNIVTNMMGDDLYSPDGEYVHIFNVATLFAAEHGGFSQLYKYKDFLEHLSTVDFYGESDEEFHNKIRSIFNMEEDTKIIEWVCTDPGARYPEEVFVYPNISQGDIPTEGSVIWVPDGMILAGFERAEGRLDAYGGIPPVVDAHNDLLHLIRSSEKLMKNDETLDFLLEFIGCYSNGSTKAYVLAFEQFGIEKAIPGLLSNLRSENELQRRMSAEVLYRLELGKMGISENGLAYLGKLYDLGKFNDPDFFVRRLNNSGLMGILSQGKGSIEGVFSVDLFSDEEIISAEVRRLLRDDLFLAKADESDEERMNREMYLRLFTENYEEILYDNPLEGTGVKLNALELYEQGWFLLYCLQLNEANDVDKLRVLQNFIKQYGDYGLKAFLALDYGGSGDDILNFTDNETLSFESKMQILKSYYEITREAFEWRQKFEDISRVSVFSTELHEAIIRKASEFFIAAQEYAKHNGSRENVRKLEESMYAVYTTLRVLRGLISRNDSILILSPERQQNPAVAKEYLAPGKKDATEEGRYNWYFIDPQTKADVRVLIRPQDTFRSNGDVTGARINFDVRYRNGVGVRIAFDNSRYQMLVGEADRPYISMDLNVRMPGEEGVVEDILSIVPASERSHNEGSFSAVTQEKFEDICLALNRHLMTEFSEV